MLTTRKVSFSPMLHTHLRSPGSWWPISLTQRPLPPGTLLACDAGAEGCCQKYQMSHPLIFHCPNLEVDPGVEGLKTHMILEAHFKEIDIKLKM